jgi:hypothetical protein
LGRSFVGENGAKSGDMVHILCEKIREFHCGSIEVVVDGGIRRTIENSNVKGMSVVSNFGVLVV